MAIRSENAVDKFITRDVAALGKAGLVTVTEKAHPSHGRMKEVRARATAIKLEALVA